MADRIVINISPLLALGKMEAFDVIAQLPFELPYRGGKPVAVSQQQVADYLQKFHEWEESFRSPAERVGYIQRLCERIAHRFKPEKIILFGSHAYGQPASESDVDLLVVMNFEGSPIQQAIKISLELGLVTPMDLLVRTPEQVQERLRMEDPFMREIVERGEVMYEADHSRVGAQS